MSSKLVFAVLLMALLALSSDAKLYTKSYKLKCVRKCLKDQTEDSDKGMFRSCVRSCFKPHKHNTEKKAETAADLGAIPYAVEEADLGAIPVAVEEADLGAIPVAVESMSDSFSSAPANGATLQATASVNIRSGPCSTNAVIRAVSSGTTMRYAGSSSSGCGYVWYKVTGTFGTGYVASNFVRATSSSSTPSSSGSSSSYGASAPITVEKLRAIMPNLSSSRANSFISHLKSGMTEGKITTCPRMAAFLAQLAHESGQLNWWEEFASGAAYEGRRDLGNTQRGDGRRYKGRGPIQLTGRANYRAAGQALGLPLESNPDMVKQSSVGFRTAIWFWNTKNLNSYADQNTQSSFDQVTRRINGGYNGKADRDKYWRKAKSVLGC